MAALVAALEAVAAAGHVLGKDQEAHGGHVVEKGHGEVERGELDPDMVSFAAPVLGSVGGAEVVRGYDSSHRKGLGVVEAD
jgi:hypothetical protein